MLAPARIFHASAGFIEIDRITRNAYQSLVRRPVLLVASVLTMTLCIGLNSAMFSLVDAVLLRALPYAHSGRLVVLFETNPQRKSGLQGVAPVCVEEWNAMSRSFTALAGVESQILTETSGTVPEKLASADASPRFFSLLNATPLLGRTFTPEEERFGGPNAALISEQLWSRRFGRAPTALGKGLRLHGELFPIVGVMPASFRMPMTNDVVDVWIPSGYPPALMKNREDRCYQAG